MRPWHVLKVVGLVLALLMLLLARIGTYDHARFVGYLVLMAVGGGLFWIGGRWERAEKGRR